MSVETLSMLGIGFSLGFMHALDADHVMAVSVLSSRKPSLKRTLKCSANWALGHAGVLLASGALLFGLRLPLYPAIQQMAELSVGFILIGLGVFCLCSLKNQRLSLQKHCHGNIVHWHYEGDVTQKGHGDDAQSKVAHAPVMVGMLHGLAGSAPALALIPAVSEGQYWPGLGYLLIFSMGVMLSMLGFGLGWGSLQRKLYQKNLSIFEWNRRAIAVISIMVGGYWLVQAA